MSIPKVIFRSVPEVTSEQVEIWWSKVQELHPGWQFITYRDPIDKEMFPTSSPYWDRCESGAQMSGLVRLEGLWRHGGIWLDSDVEVYRSLEPLLQVEGFAGFEDPGVIPDAILGARPGHPAIKECLILAVKRLVGHSGDWRTDGSWGTGPGVMTTVLPGRSDFLILPPACFYPYHYTEKETRRGEDHSALPWCFAAHHWHGSWL